MAQQEKQKKKKDCAGGPGGNDDIRLLKSTRVQVYVDEALPDILVVTYELGVRIFKGVLLDSTKKNIPCGITHLNPVFNVSPSKSKPDDDTLYSVNQRFAYTDPSSPKKKNVHISTKYKSNKMTVRLRPRQVLCSKCKGICNENSENVTRKRKQSEQPVEQPAVIKRSANAPITRSTAHLQLRSSKPPVMRRTLIPKKNPSVTSALSGNVNKLNIDNNKRVLSNSNSPLSSSDNTPQIPQKDKRMLRKKRSVDSMDEVWDETVFDEGANNVQGQSNEQPLSSTNTRTIKICYGPQGEGTVLKIPAQIENLNVVEDDLEENINVEEVSKDLDKAARKAMKKARKEAKRKIVTAANSPEHHMSPRYSVGASSPRYTVGSASPRHGLGNNSPRYMPPILEPITPKKRKHKMKHKKKHKDDKEKERKHNKEDEVVLTQEEVSREQCLTQKLSINLKRLSTSYIGSQNGGGEKEESSSDEQCDPVPDFPPVNPPLVVRINAPTISSAPGADGERVVVGDIVWGKIIGFPWWPGKVLTITHNDSTNGPQAHVAWYGSSTSSLIQCDQLCPYLDNFKTRYNKKKRGPYKEAIRQATSEARTSAEQKLVVTSPAHSIIPSALASPREINVIS